MFESIGTITLIVFMLLSMWWCLRQYYRARGKGYYPALAATVVFGVALIAVIAGIALLDTFWYGTATMVTLLLFPVPALVVTVLVALLPHRPRRVGERRSSFLPSPTSGALKVGFRAARVLLRLIPIALGVVVFGVYVTRILSKSELDGYLVAATLIFLVLFGVDVLGFARERLGAPGLAETVALLPHRPRRVGERRSSFLPSPTSGALKVGFRAARVLSGVIPIAFGVVVFGGHITGILPKSELDDYLAGTATLIFLFLFGVAWLGFARERLGAPGLAETVAADTRSAVLYLRAFQQESNPFAWVAPQEHPRYTRRPPISNSVTFEQYFGAEFARQLGPFIALGNPLDSAPPEGAARSYAPDEDWQRHFCTLASAAGAIVMDGSRSDNLSWEFAEITRNRWQRKLFLLTAPVPQQRGGRLWSAALRSAKGVRIPRWEQFAAELTKAGLHVPPTKPGPGSVVAFDAAGQAKVLIRGAQQPEEFVTVVRTHLGDDLIEIDTVHT